MGHFLIDSPSEKGFSAFVIYNQTSNGVNTDAS